MSAEIALLQLVLTPQNGATWLEGSVQGLTQMTSFPEFHASGGSPSLLQQWRALSSGVQCGQGWDPLNKRLPFHNRGPWLGFHSTVPRRQRRLVWTRSVFASFSCTASGARSPSRPPSAGVASHLTPGGHHRAACATSGVLGRRGFPWESCAVRICREAGARVSTNIRVQDLDFLPGGQLDDRRLEVVADGLPLFHGAQLAIDTTLVSLVRADGAPRRQCATRETALLSTGHAAPRSADTPC